VLTKLICWFLGHKFWAKAIVGEPFNASPNQITGLPVTGHYYRYEKQKFCLRCGYENGSDYGDEP